MNARSQFAVRTLVAAISACFAGGASTAPQAPTVVAGQAGFQQSGNTLTITNTPGTIINWQSFSINRDEVVRFLQQSASSQVLNRVTGIDPSVILGQLQSNGRVLLINPNGVLFGKGSQVDVAGLLVSTLQLKDADFLAGRYKFNDTPGAGGIDNQGTIRTQAGGHVILIAPKVENSGLIQSPEGHILLAAGRSVTLADPDKPAIQVEVTNRDNTAVNLGALIAKNVTLYGGIIKNSGLIQATTAVVGENGKIRLQAKYDVENTGTLQANGTQGGDILVQAAEGIARVQGTVEARGTITSAKPENAPKTENAGKGGRIEILAPEIIVNGVVDASGTTGGGAIFIGGQYQGGNSPVPTDWSANPALQRVSLSLDNPYAASPSVTATATGSGDSAPSNTTDQNAPLIPNRNLPTARTTTIGVNARIRADGLEEGDGGVVVVWSDESTQVAGLISARGGQLSGNGGLIETSGKIDLVVDIPADASAVAGRAGLWLLDPNNIQITNVDANITGNPDFTSTNNTATINAATIQTALNAGTNVTISTGTAGTNSQAGDILVSSAINVSSATTTKFTLQAHNNITFVAGVSASGAGALNLELIPDSDASGAGKAIINSTLSLNGGALSVLGSGTVDFIGSTINASAVTANTANFSAGSNTLNATSTFTNVNASGGSQTGSGVLTAANVTMTSGSLGGSGGVTITNNLDWQAGTFYGATVLSSGTTAILSTTGSKVVGANFTNDGTLTINSGRIQINSGFILQNSAGGTINLNSSDASPIYFGTGNSTFNNLGTLNQLATGTHEINLSLGTYNNSGSVNVQAGTLRLRNTGTDSGNYVLAAGASLESSAGAIRTFSGSITGGGTFSVTGGTATIGSGAVISSGLALTSGTLNIATGAAQTVSALSLTGGTLNSSDSLTVTGAATLSGGTLTGNLTTQGTSTLGMFYLAGGNWTNQGVATLGGSSYIQLSSGTNTITNAAGATLNLNTSNASGVYWYASGASVFNNVGTLVQQATGSHEIVMGSSGQFNNTGLVSVQAGTLQLGTPGSSTGTFDIASGATLANSRNYGTPTTFAAGSSITGNGTFQVTTGTVNVQGALASGLVLGVSGGTLNIATGAAQTVSTLSLTGGTLNASDSLTVTGAATLSGGTLTGNLTTQGTSTLGMFYLAGGNWTNQGVATLGGSSYIQLTSGTNTITNAAGATLNLNTSNASGVYWYASGASVFNNVGTLVQQATGSHEIVMGSSGQFNNTGLVSVQAGTLQLGTPGSSTGTFDIASGATLANSRNYGTPTTFAAGSSITGNGTFQVTTGTVNVQGALASGLALGVSGGTLNIATGAAQAVSALSLTGGTLNASDSLTVTGAATLSGGTLSGNLTTQGTSTLGTFYLAGSNWTNLGVATLGGSSNIQLSSGTNTITNAAGATFNLNTSNSSAIYYTSGATGVFSNAGTLVQQATGSHEIWTGSSGQFNNAGLVSVQAGTLQIGSPGSSTGTFDIASGATLTNSRSNATPTTFAAGSSITGNGTFLVTTGTVNVQGALASTLTLGVSGGGTLNLTSGASKTVSALSLTGGTLNASDSLTVTGASTLSGGTLTGTLTTQGTSTANGSLSLSGATWLNQGVVTIGGSGSVTQLSGTNSITNAVGGTFNLNTSSVYAINSSSATGVFNNYGSVVHQASGAHQIWMGAGGQFNNTGTVDVQAGTLQLQASGSDTGNYAVASGAAVSFVSGTRTVSGTVSGAGTLQNAGGATTFGVGSVASTSQISVTGGTLTLNGTILPSGLSVSGGTLALNDGAAHTLGTLSLTGGTLNTSEALTVTGATTLGAGTLTGTGSVTTNGTTSLSSGYFNLSGGVTWNNAGSATVSGTSSRIQFSGGTLNNLAGGSLALNSTDSYEIYFLSGTNAFNNAGTITKSATGLQTIYAASGTNSFNNTGTVDVQAGILQISAGGSDSGAYSIASGSTLQFAGGTRTVSGNISGAGTLLNSGGTTTLAAGSTTTVGAVSVTGGTLTMAGASTLDSIGVSAGTLNLTDGAAHTLSTLSLTGGTLNSTDALTVSGAATLNGGNLSGGGILTTQGTTSVGALWVYGGTTWNNAGTATVSGIVTVYLEGATLNNLVGATLNLNSSASTPISFYSGTNVFNNAGTLTQQAAGTRAMARVSGTASFNNTGTVDAQAGTLQIGIGGTDSGRYTIGTGAMVDFTAGTRAMDASSRMDGTGSMKVSGASLQFLGAYNLSTAPVVTGGSLDFQPSNYVSLGAYTASTGTYVWGANALFTSYVNSGATTTFASGISANSLTVSSGTLNLSGRFTGGTLTKSGGTLNLVNAILNGDVSVNNGQTVNVSNGLTFENNHAIYLNDTGSTTTLSVNGAQTVGGWGRIVFNGTGANHRIFTNVSNSTPGIVFDTGVTVDVYNGSGRIDGAGAISQVFENKGMIYIDPGKTLGLQVIANITNSGTIYNEGTLNIDPSMSGSANCCYFNNKGALNALSGTVNLLGNGNDLGGVYNVSTGATLNFNGAGTRTFSGSGAQISNAGTVKFASGTFNLGDGFVVSGVGGTTLASGTLTVDGTASISNYAQSGGTLNGMGTLTATNSLNWTGGTMSGSGTTVVAAGATGAINTATGYLYLYRTLSDQGTINYSGTGYDLGIFAGGNLNIAAGGVLNLTTDGQMGRAIGSTGGVITNSGTIRKTGGTGISYFAYPVVGTSFNNTGGSFDVQTGVIDVQNFNASGNSSITSGTVQVSAGTGTVAGVLTGAGTLKLTGGTLTVDGTASISNYAQSGGSLNGSGTLTVTNGLNWSAGTMSGTGTTQIASTASASLLNSGLKTLGRMLKNDGIVVQDSGSSLVIGATGTIDNTGTFQLVGTSELSSTYYAGSRFINSGVVVGGMSNVNTLFVNAGGTLSGGLLMKGGFSLSGASRILAGGQVVLESSLNTATGTLDIASGAALTVESGTLTVGSSFATTGSGKLVLPAGTPGGTLTVNGTASINNMLLNGGRINGNGTLTSSGTFDWLSGSLEGNLKTEGQFNVTGSGSKASSGNLEIAGGNIVVDSTATLIKNGGQIIWSGGALSGQGVWTLQNGAVFNVLGSGARVLNGPSLNVTTFDIASGSLDVQSGSLTLAGGNLAAGVTMTLTGGSITNSGLLDVAGVINLAGGTLAGTGALNVSGTLQKTTAGTTTLAMAVNNAGTVDVQAGSLNLAGGGMHSGTFVTHSGTALGFTGGTHSFGDGTHFSGAGSFVGGGALSLTGTGAGLTIDAGTSVNLNALSFGGTGNLTNAGMLTGSGVTLGGSLINTGAASLTGGAVNGGLTNTGTFNVIGTVTLGGSSAILVGGAINLGSGATLVKDGGMLYWSGGTFGGSGTLAYVNGGNFAFSGNGDRIIDNPNLTFAFTGLTLPNGSLTLNNGGLTFNGNTSMPAGTALNMYGGTITNNGPLDIGGQFGLYGGTLAGAGAINMSGGTIDLPANSTVNWTATGAMSNSGTLNLSNRTITNAITNNGTINTTGGLVFTQLFTNQGTFNLNSGTTTFSAGFLQNSGSTKLGTGAGTSANVVAGGSGFNVAGGTLSGSGSIAGDLNFGNGILSVGFSPGSLSITGNLNLSAGSITNIELGGTAPGSGYDTIAVSGTANLAGVLNVTSYGGYVPAAGSSYNFMSFGSSTGAFGSTNLPAGWAMSMSSASTYLQLLMAAAQAAGVSPLQALMQALAAASGSAGGAASDPGAATMGGTSVDFNRVTPNDLATSLMQQVMGVTQVLPSSDFEDLKVCQ